MDAKDILPGMGFIMTDSPDNHPAIILRRKGDNEIEILESESREWIPYPGTWEQLSRRSIPFRLVIIT